MIRNPIYGKIKNGNQTTNQIFYILGANTWTSCGEWRWRSCSAHLPKRNKSCAVKRPPTAQSCKWPPGDTLGHQGGSGASCPTCVEWRVKFGQHVAIECDWMILSIFIRKYRYTAPRHPNPAISFTTKLSKLILIDFCRLLTTSWWIKTSPTCLPNLPKHSLQAACAPVSSPLRPQAGTVGPKKAETSKYLVTGGIPYSHLQSNASNWPVPSQSIIVPLFSLAKSSAIQKKQKQHDPLLFDGPMASLKPTLQIRPASATTVKPSSRQPS